MQPIEKLLSKRQQSELVTSIKGRGEVPVKFSYLGGGAKNWDRVARLRLKSRGGINSLEGQLLARKASFFIGAFGDAKKFNIVDLGPGNGDPALPIINELLKEKIKFRYVPIDISKEMLKLACARIKSKIKGVETIPIQLDFEEGSFPDKLYDLKSGGYSNLLLFLGSTLGNFSDVHRVLTNFRDSMTSEDYIIIGVQLANYSKIKLILSHYTTQELGDLFYYIPEQMGIKRQNTIWTAAWNDPKHQVEVKATLKRDLQIKVGKENFLLEKDEDILLVRSIKYTESSFTGLLQDSGFRTELFTSSKDQTYAVSMVQPTRYTSE